MYLFERQSDEGRKREARGRTGRSSIHSFILQMATPLRARPGCGQQPGIPYRTSMWLAVSQVLESSFAASQAGTPFGTLMWDSSIINGSLTHHATMTAQDYSIRA